MLVHTGQNYDRALSDVFFARARRARARPSSSACAADGFGEQIGADHRAAPSARCSTEQPDRAADPRRHQQRLSAAIVAKRARHPGLPHGGGQPLLRRPRARGGQPAHHRPQQRRADALHRAQPRRICCARASSGERIFVTGNPIHEVLDALRARRSTRRTCSRGSALERGRVFPRHDAPRRERGRPSRGCARSSTALDAAAARVRPAGRRAACTRARATGWSVRRRRRRRAQVRLLEPFGFFDFVALERDAVCVLTRQRHGAGGVLHLPRAERHASATSPSAPRRSSAAATSCRGADPDDDAALRAHGARPARRRGTAPPEYLAEDVSDDGAADRARLQNHSVSWGAHPAGRGYDGAPADEVRAHLSRVAALRDGAGRSSNGCSETSTPKLLPPLALHVGRGAPRPLHGRAPGPVLPPAAGPAQPRPPLRPQHHARSGQPAAGRRPARGASRGILRRERCAAWSPARETYTTSRRAISPAVWRACASTLTLDQYSHMVRRARRSFLRLLRAAGDARRGRRHRAERVHARRGRRRYGVEPAVIRNTCDVSVYEATEAGPGAVTAR